MTITRNYLKDLREKDVVREGEHGLLVKTRCTQASHDWGIHSGTR